MRTELRALAAVAVVTAAPSPTRAEGLLEAHRFSVSVPVEVTLVGLTVGLHPELLWRFGDELSASRLRLGVGLLDGPDHLFAPISFGYRAVWRSAATVQPQAGLGLELQSRWVSDFPTVHQLAMYFEAGVGFALSPSASAGLMVSTDISVTGGFGFGLSPRVFATWRL